MRRTIEVDGRTVPLSVELNQRDSHELSTHILRILLEEVMGYNVTLARFSADPFTLARLSGCSVAQGLSECCVGPNCAPENLPQLTVPEVMVDVEVWPWQLDQRSSMWLRYGNNILSAGTLGSVGWCAQRRLFLPPTPHARSHSCLLALTLLRAGAAFSCRSTRRSGCGSRA